MELQLARLSQTDALDFIDWIVYVCYNIPYVQPDMIYMFGHVLLPITEIYDTFKYWKSGMQRNRLASLFTQLFMWNTQLCFNPVGNEQVGKLTKKELNFEYPI